MKILSKILMILSILVVACNPDEDSGIRLISKKNFEATYKGQEISLYNLVNKNGITVQITNFGGRVVSLWVPGSDGKFSDVVLGYNDFEGYLQSNEPYFGALIGRYGNRIGKGLFSINENRYRLAINNEPNHLHGGPQGFHNVGWGVESVSNDSLVLTYLSKDMEEGYPGNLQVKVVYQLTDQNELKVEYWATTDAPTVVNLTHHSFFNLHGEGKGSINDHILYIDADNYTPVDAGSIPTGEIAPVLGTPMDFTQPVTIGKRVNDDFEQLKYGLGYDHNWVLNPAKEEIRLAVRISEPVSGRTMEVYTNEPGLQFYGGNFLNGKDKGKCGLSYDYRSAFCLETQHFPDSPNHAGFPSTLLIPGEEYYSVCIYKFSVK